MERGLLMQQTFNLKSPALQKELDGFVQKLGERMKKYRVEKYTALRRFKSDDLMEIIVIPCSPQSGKPDADGQKLIQNFEAEGFQAAAFSTANDLSRYATSEMEPTQIRFGS